MKLHATGGLLSRFAHLTGGLAAKAKTEEDDKKDDKKKDVAPGDEEEADEGEGDDDPKAETDEDQQDNDDNNKKQGKKARAIRMAERARCAAIFGHAAAADNTALAAELAFNTDLPASAAAALLAAAPKPARISGLSMRMAAVAPITIGAEEAGAGEPKSKAEEARTFASTLVASARAAGLIRK